MRNLHCYWVSLFNKHFKSLVVVSMMMVVVCLEGKMSSLQFRTYRRVGFNTAPLPTSDRGRGLTPHPHQGGYLAHLGQTPPPTSPSE